MNPNASSINDDSTVNSVRKAIEHRATWMGLMCLEAEKNGGDWEGIARKAVSQTGRLRGEAILEALEGKNDIPAFAKEFLPELSKKLFEMEVTEFSEDKLEIEFNYCPLVSAWRKLGIDDERIKILCDIAMDGDRGIARQMGFDFTLGGTIAKGSGCCEVLFRKPRT